MFPLTLHAVFGKHPKTRNGKAENGSIFSRERKKTPNFEMQLTKAHKNYFEPGSLNGVFLRGHVDPSYLYCSIYFLCFNEAALRRFCPKQGGNTRNANGGVGRSR